MIPIFPKMLAGFHLEGPPHLTKNHKDLLITFGVMLT